MTARTHKYDSNNVENETKYQKMASNGAKND